VQYPEDWRDCDEKEERRKKQKEMAILIPTIRSLIEAINIWTKEMDDVHIVHEVGRSSEVIFNSEEKIQII
jgi:hypothetical protein